MLDFITLTDGYKLDHRRQYPAGTQKVYSNFTPRASRIKGVDKVGFFGLQYLLGASRVPRRVLSRSAPAVRRHHVAGAALLRLDPVVDRRLPAGVRGDRREEPSLAGPVRS